MSLPFVFAVVLLSVVGATYQQQRPTEHKCDDNKTVDDAHRFDTTKFPKDCKYYCNTSSEANAVWFGYFKAGEPCADSQGDTGTCKTEGKEVVCDTGVKPPTC